jgi:hypothetical protein
MWVFKTNEFCLACDSMIYAPDHLKMQRYVSDHIQGQVYHCFERELFSNLKFEHLVLMTHLVCVW